MSYTLSIGSQAPKFNLLATDERHHTLEEFSHFKLLVLFFTCNHCPYVIGSNENTRQLAKEYAQKEVGFVAINSNSANTYPEDSFEHMKEVMKKEQYPWTYLYDEDQSVARAYGALCTPHFFLFNEKRKLIYTGRAVDSPKDIKRATTHELKDAIESSLKNDSIKQPMTNPIGCNIKWDGKPPHWMPPEACSIV